METGQETVVAMAPTIVTENMAEGNRPRLTSAGREDIMETFGRGLIVQTWSLRITV